MNGKPISIVIPTLNAAATLGATLAALDEGREIIRELIIVDGGSQDATTAIAAGVGAELLTVARGRGGQLVAGAQASQGDWLLFLHADTRLLPGWAAAVSAFMAEPAALDRAGVFRLAFDDTGAAARRVAALANWRTARLGLPYGDQGLLISRRLYQALGGYRALPLMEDVEFVRRIGGARLRLLPATACTSAAGYRRQGWWRRPTRNLTLLSLYFLGVPPRWLVRLYS